MAVGIREGFENFELKPFAGKWNRDGTRILPTAKGDRGAAKKVIRADEGTKVPR